MTGPVAVHHPAVLATAFTGLAGFLDAVGYAQLGKLYVSFMSGNSTHLGMSIAGGDLSGVLTAAGVIGCFVTGAALGGYLTRAPVGPDVCRILLVELLFLAAASFLYFGGHGREAVFLLPVAMGVQNAAVLSVAGTNIGKTFMTGALVGFGQGLGRAIGGQHVPGWQAQGISWCVFLAGVLLGAMVWSTFSVSVCLAISTVFVAFLLFLYSSRRKRSEL